MERETIKWGIYLASDKVVVFISLNPRLAYIYVVIKGTSGTYFISYIYVNDFFRIRKHLSRKLLQDYLKPKHDLLSFLAVPEQNIDKEDETRIKLVEIAKKHI